MHYSDSLIPRLLPAAHTTTLRGMPTQMLVLKIDGERSVGELRMLLRHIGSFDIALERLVAQSLVELTQPAPVPDDEPADENTEHETFVSGAGLGEILRSLTEAYAPRPGEDEASFKARVGADPDQPFYPAARDHLLTGLQTEPNARLARRLTMALHDHELLGLFRYWLESAIIESTAGDAMTLIGFQRQLDAALRHAQQTSAADTHRSLAD